MAEDLSRYCLPQVSPFRADREEANGYILVVVDTDGVRDVTGGEEVVMSLEYFLSQVW